MPVIFALARRTGIRAFAPLALVIALGVNVAFEQPLNVEWQWRGLTRTANTATLDNFLHSKEFVPGATYRVLRSGADAKLGLYHVLRAGGRLDSELFPESMAMRSFSSLSRLRAAALRPPRRLRDRVRPLHEIAAHQRARRAETTRRGPQCARVRLRAIVHRPNYVVYAVDRTGCSAPS